MYGFTNRGITNWFAIRIANRIRNYTDSVITFLHSRFSLRRYGLQLRVFLNQRLHWCSRISPWSKRNRSWDIFDRTGCNDCCVTNLYTSGPKNSESRADFTRTNNGACVSSLSESKGSGTCNSRSNVGVGEDDRGRRRDRVSDELQHTQLNEKRSRKNNEEVSKTFVYPPADKHEIENPRFVEFRREFVCSEITNDDTPFYAFRSIIDKAIEDIALYAEDYGLYKYERVYGSCEVPFDNCEIFDLREDDYMYLSHVHKVHHCLVTSGDVKNSMSRPFSHIRKRVIINPYSDPVKGSLLCLNASDNSCIVEVVGSFNRYDEQWLVISPLPIRCESPPCMMDSDHIKFDFDVRFTDSNNTYSIHPVVRWTC